MNKKNIKQVFDIDLIAKKVIETFKNDGQEAAFRLIDSTMLILSNTLNHKNESNNIPEYVRFNKVQESFKKFQRLLSQSKIGLSINDDAFYTMIRRNHSILFDRYCRKYKTNK